MKKFQTILTFYLIIFIHLLPAQTIIKRFDHLTIENGLSESFVHCSVQDNKGFMWFGTQDGLNKYDGYKFTVYKETEDAGSLSDIHVKCLAKDWSGNLWVGTENGLNLYLPETENFKYYLNQPNNPQSISNNNIRTMFVCGHDGKKHFWLGTENGLNLFYPETGLFENYFHDPGNENSISDNKITALCEDSYGILWIGTTKGLDQYDIYQEKILHHYHDQNNTYSINNENITSILEDNIGNIWIGTLNGLYIWERKTARIKKAENSSLKENIAITSLWKDHNNILWIGTKQNGLSFLDTITNTFITFMNDPKNPKSINSNYVQTIYEDNKGVLWIGTSNGGINKTDLDAKKFYTIRCPSETPGKLTSNDIRGLYKDSNGFLWIGTMGGGLFKYNLPTKTFHQYTHIPGDKHSLSSNNVRQVIEDRYGKLWISTDDRGVNIFDKKTGKCIHYLNDEKNPNSLTNNSIRQILEDHSGTIWIGTYGGGLNKFNRPSQSFTCYKYDPNNPNSLRSNYIYSLYEDNEKTLWVGTDGGGLAKFDRETGTFTNYQSDKKNKNTISNDYILAINEDRLGRLWIGTDRGVNLMDRKPGVFTRFLEKEGLPNNVVYAILDDRFGNIWVSTNRGIACINPNEKKIKTYDISDGLQENEFNGGAYSQTKGDTLFFGGMNGINMFLPEEIQENKYLPEIVFTDFKIYNQPVKVNEKIEGRIVLTRCITETKRIHLTYKHNVFSFEYVALHYANPDKNQYAYILKGFDKQWNYVSNQRYAIYTNLPYRKYTFMVKASNNSGRWNEKPATIELVITPPFWRKWWFISFSVILIMGSIFYRYTTRLNEIKKQNILLEQKVKERTREITLQKEEIEENNKALEQQKKEIEEKNNILEQQKEELSIQRDALIEANATKDKFFSIISHDLKSPFNALLGFAEVLKENLSILSKEKLEKYTDHIYASARQLYNLVENLLAWASAKSGKLKSTPIKLNVYNVIEDAISIAAISCEKKEISFTSSLEKNAFAFADENLISATLRNLISNAIKYSPPKSMINIISVTKNTFIEISVSDHGTGIKKEDIDKIFRKDIHFTTKGTGQEKGTGLGLILCKEFVENSGGKIWVHSIPGQGTTFTFTLPKYNNKMEKLS